MAWCEFAERKIVGNGSGPYRVKTAPWKIVLHTTEGLTAEGAFATYRSTGNIPHFTVDKTTIYQHLDTTIAATALLHKAGTVETNHSRALQIELVCKAGLPKPKEVLRNAVKLCRWLEKVHGVPQVWPNGPCIPPKPPVPPGSDPGRHNRNATNWNTKSGYYGHEHVPGNTHWDPALTIDETVILMGAGPYIPVIVLGIDRTDLLLAAVKGGTTWVDLAGLMKALGPTLKGTVPGGIRIGLRSFANSTGMLLSGNTKTGLKLERKA